MKKLNKFTILIFTISGIILLPYNFTATVKANAYNRDNEIITYTDKIEWRYIVVDGKLYKRQYNTTTKKWIGKWIPA